MNWSNLDHTIFWPHEHVGWNQFEGETLVESQAASVLHQKRLTGGQTALETPSTHIVPNYCSDWPGVRRWERNQTLNFSLRLSFFKLCVSISVTFYVNNVPHYENAPDETVWKSAPLSTYLNDISISYKSMKAGFSLVPRGPTTRCDELVQNRHNLILKLCLVEWCYTEALHSPNTCLCLHCLEQNGPVQTQTGASYSRDSVLDKIGGYCMTGPNAQTSDVAYLYLCNRKLWNRLTVNVEGYLLLVFFLVVCTHLNGVLFCLLSPIVACCWAVSSN